jgi:hypothetical protein
MLGRGGKLARRRIEQHAYIPYTHGCRRLCDRLVTKPRLVHEQELLTKSRRTTADATRLRPTTILIIRWQSLIADLPHQDLPH